MASARRRKDCFTSFLFVLPLLTLFLVFFAYPIIYNIVISFYDWNGISVEKVFVGFANYKKLWADSVMQKTFRNFVIIAISTTVIQSALAKKILGSTDVARIKALGRLVRNYNDSYWSGIRQIVVYEGLLAKFKQNEDLKRKLLGTGNNVLAECAVRDQIWGIGLSMKNPDRFEPENWNGQNLLGYALMMVRESL